MNTAAEEYSRKDKENGYAETHILRIMQLAVIVVIKKTSSASVARAGSR